MSYLETTKSIYKDAALTPDIGLCCTTTPIWQFPGLSIPTRMQEMNYGCGSTVHPRDLVKNLICRCRWRDGIVTIQLFFQTKKWRSRN